MSPGRLTLAVPAALLVLALGAPTVSPAAALGTLRSADVTSAATTSPAAWRAALVFVIALPLVFPPIAAGVRLLGVVGSRRPLGAWSSAHGLPVVDHLAGVALAEFFSCAPFVVVAAAAAFAEVDVQLEEAARTLGARTLGVFMRVPVPSPRRLERALAVAYIFVALAACVVVAQAFVRRRLL